jgi:DNA-binding CsgD family transcriptional regulator
MMAAALPHSRKSLQPARDHDSAKWACEKRLGNYIRQAWNVVEPATAFLDNWHLDLIAEYIEAVTAGQITIAQARDRERQVLQLFLRGLSWVEIGRQLGFSSMGAIKAFNRAFKRIPAKDVEKLRTLQSERLNDARRRVYT